MHAHAGANSIGRPSGAAGPVRQPRHRRTTRPSKRNFNGGPSKSRKACGKLAAVSAPAREVGDKAGLDSRTGCTVSFSVTGDVRSDFLNLRLPFPSVVTLEPLTP